MKKKLLNVNLLLIYIMFLSTILGCNNKSLNQIKFQKESESLENYSYRNVKNVFVSKKVAINQESFDSEDINEDSILPRESIKITTSKTTIKKGEQLKLYANHLSNIENDKWIWEISPLLPFKGYITYFEKDNSAIFTADGNSGNIEITAISLLTNKKTSIKIRVEE